MKSGSANLRAALYSSDDVLVADLVSVYFDAGVQRFTTLLTDLTTSGGTAFSASALAPVELAQGMGSEVEAMEVTLGLTGQAVAGQGFMDAAVAGLFDDIRCLVQRAATTGTFASYPDADLMTVYDGRVVQVQPRRDNSLVLTVQSPLSLGEVPASHRVVGQTCPFGLGDTDCAVAVASFRDSRTVASGSTASVVKLNSASAFAVVGSVLSVTSGDWTGQTRVVRSVSGADLTLDVPLPGIQTGASVTVTRACDKLRTTCDGVFGNVLRFGGFVNAPVKE